LYRQERAAIRKEKQLVLEKEEIDEVDKRFDVNALRVLKARYLRRDATGKLIETPKQLFTRVAVHAALPDLFYDARVFDFNSKQPVNMIEDFKPAVYEGQYGIGNYKLNRYHLEALKRMYNRFNRNKQMKVAWSKFFEMIKTGQFNDYEKNIDAFYNLMTYKLFMPNTPAIANFGNPLGMGSACFALDVPDSIDGIMETLKSTAIVFKAGGGMGYNFSKLRPEGDFVSSTGGVASGPLSFMRLFDTMTDVIKQGGIRRGANMGILNSNHPDIEKFITAKEGNKSLRNFNISVLIMPDFWEHYEKNEPYPLVNPKDGAVVKTVNPRVLFDKIVYQAWESAEPGVIF
ncbi:MAG: ribonucleotide reductase N-terminal alpha domain-containing protein, partial [Nanoarchaeota archaeon]